MVNDALGRHGLFQRTAAMTRLVTAGLERALLSRLAGVPAVLAKPDREFGQLLLGRDDHCREHCHDLATLSHTRFRLRYESLQCCKFTASAVAPGKTVAVNSKRENLHLIRKHLPFRWSNIFALQKRCQKEFAIKSYIW